MQYKILIKMRELGEIISECLLAGVVVVIPWVLYATMLGKLSVVSPSIKYLRFEMGKSCIHPTVIFGHSEELVTTF